MKTLTLNIYTADELKTLFPAAFDKARMHYNDTAGGDNFWTEGVVSDFLEIAGLMGFTVTEKDIAWSGFGSQGDGASFTGSAVFAADALEKVREYAPQDMELHRIAGECAKYGRNGICAGLSRVCRAYSHENTVLIDDAWRVGAEGCLEGTSTTTHEILETCRSLMRWLYRQLEKEYEYRTSEDTFLETAGVNEWHFTEDGKMVSE